MPRLQPLGHTTSDLAAPAPAPIRAPQQPQPQVQEPPSDPSSSSSSSSSSPHSSPTPSTSSTQPTTSQPLHRNQLNQILPGHQHLPQCHLPTIQHQETSGRAQRLTTKTYILEHLSLAMNNSRNDVPEQALQSKN